MQTLTIIPAKIGSTRLPRKNILPLMGKPLLDYTIGAAINSGVCGEIMVSTDSREVADIATAAGAQVPFMRPAKLGRDPYGVEDVCLHVLDEYEKKARAFERLIILLPTSPFRNGEDICRAAAIFTEENASFLMSVSAHEHNPLAALCSRGGSRVMTPCFPELIHKKKHELPETYRANGAITILDIAAFRQAGTYYGEPLHTYIMPWERSVDIDTEIDFRFAEFLLQEGLVESIREP